MKTTRILVAMSVLLVARETNAQLPEAGTASFSMAGTGLASARGYAAIALNPANLGFSTNPGYSINLLTAGGTTGLDPVRFNDIANFGGKLIPATVKEQWLQTIGSGTERGSVDGGLNVVALTAGYFGFQAGIVGTGVMNLNGDATEAILFGNAGRTGAPKNFAFNGSTADGSVFGTGAVSVGIPLYSSSHGSQFTIGVTGKYVVGLAAGRARDNGSSVTPDNLQVQFPSIYTPDTARIGSAGNGAGVDVGMAWSNGHTSVGATVRNVVNTFAWAPSAFRASLGTLSFDGGINNSSNFNDTTYASAPAALRDALEAEKFKPEVAFGFSHQVGDLTIAVDGHQRLGDGIDIGPKMHVGGGAEYTVGALVLRAGGAAVTDGARVAGGIGLRVLGYEFGVGVSSRSKSGGQELGVLVSLFSIQ